MKTKLLGWFLILCGIGIYFIPGGTVDETGISSLENRQISSVSLYDLRNEYLDVIHLLRQETGLAPFSVQNMDEYRITALFWNGEEADRVHEFAGWLALFSDEVERI